MFQTALRFTHHSRSFTIEADGWPDEEAASAAMIDLQIWAMRLDADKTAALYAALSAESLALVQETLFDHDQEPLPTVRDVQRRAVQSALQGRSDGGGGEPTVTIEAYQVSAT